MRVAFIWPLPTGGRRSPGRRWIDRAGAMATAERTRDGHEVEHLHRLADGGVAERLALDGQRHRARAVDDGDRLRCAATSGRRPDIAGLQHHAGAGRTLELHADHLVELGEAAGIGESTGTCAHLDILGPDDGVAGEAVGEMRHGDHQFDPAGEVDRRLAGPRPGNGR